MSLRLLTLFSLILLMGTANAQNPSPLEIELETFITGLSSPVGIEHAGDERLFILEKNSGVIEIYDLNGDYIGDFLDIDGLSTASEQGLLGLAFHPNYQENGRFFINYTQTDGTTVISEFEVSDDPDVADENSEQVLMTIDQPFGNHNGGGLEFGLDGYLYIGTGDGGSGGDPEGNGQNPNALLGKMLRIDVDSGDPYGIPADNPFVDDESTLDEIWALGMRNPWRYSFDPETGDLWIADVGQNAWEEINFEPADSDGGLNYGWNCYEASYEYDLSGCDGTYVDPIAEFNHNSTGFCSITGGIVYRGELYPRLEGQYFFTDYCQGDIFGLEQVDEETFEETTLLETNTFGFVAFGADVNGEPYIVDINGNVQKIVDPCGDFMPVITANNDSTELTAEGGVEYYWYINGNLDDTADGATYSPNENGEVYAVVENADGCAIQTNSIDLTIISVDEKKIDKSIKVFPNPVKNQLTIQGKVESSEIKIFNSLGQTQEVSFSQNGSQKITCDVSNLSPGMYFVRVTSDTAFKSISFKKE